jgi:aspartyl-tRNA(Asn)/glutamyl-tRNA(Gln) amidotransferase subunit C
MKSVDVEKLALLARIKLTSQEEKKLQKEFEAILNYVSILKKNDVTGIGDQEAGRTTELENITREDTNGNKQGEFSDDLLKSAPSVEDGYIKVKHIL